jgi:hypothetical protein
MARRKKSRAKRATRRRSRMSGMGGNLTSVLYIAGGAVLAQALGKAVGTALSSSSMSAMTKNLINGAVPVVAGIFTPKFIKGDVGSKLGAGMIAVGGLKLVQSAGILNGMAGVGANYYGNKQVRNIAGYQGASAGTYIAGVRNAAIMEQC